MFVLFTATMEPAGHHQLTHGASGRVAFGEHGEVVLTDYGHSDCHISLYQHDGAKYNLARKTHLPDGLGWACNKAVSDAIFLQSSYDTETYQLHTTDLQPMGRLHHKGVLLGAVFPNTLVYGQCRGGGKWIVNLHQPDGDIILEPPHERIWNWRLSVYRAEYIVVVESRTQSMDVFTKSSITLLLFCHISISNNITMQYLY